MTPEEILKLLMLPSVTHNSHWLYLPENNISSGTEINDMRTLFKKGIELYRLNNGAMLELDVSEVQQLYQKDNTWLSKFKIDNKCNSLLYTTDLTVLDICCSLLKKNGLNSILSNLKRVHNTEELTDLSAFLCVLITLVCHKGLGNYNTTVIAKLKSAIDTMPIISKAVTEIANAFKPNTRTSNSVLLNAAVYLIELGAFNLSTEFWSGLVSFLKARGYALNTSSTKPDTWSIRDKAEVIIVYLLNMLDRNVFKSLYHINNTFSLYMGICMNTDNYSASYKSFVFPAYKITLSEMVNITNNVHTSATTFIRGSEDTELAVKLSEITSFAISEILKESAITMDGECVVIQQIFQYGG